MSVEIACDARYPINWGVRCFMQGPHDRHEGVYLLAGRHVTWTDDDKRPEPPAPPEPQRTAMEEAFARAGAVPQDQP